MNQTRCIYTAGSETGWMNYASRKAALERASQDVYDVTHCATARRLCGQ